MRYSIYVFVFCCFLLSSCSGPDKLLADNRPEKALESILRMKSEKKLQKWYPEFVEAFDQLQNATTQKVQDLIESDNPAKWPHIYSIISRGVERQARVQNVLTVHSSINKEAFTFQDQWHELRERSKIESAQYYYNRVLSEKALGDAGDKNAYRAAYRLAHRVEEYVVNYENVRNLQEEVKILGTDYITIFPDYDQDKERSKWLWNDFLKDANLPWVADWVVVADDEKEIPRNDFWLRAGLDNLSVSPDFLDYNSCSNTKEVKVGTKEIEEWSAADSAYVKVEVDVFQEVTIWVNNYYQEKNSGVSLDLALIPAGSEEPKFEHRKHLGYSWTNCYAEVTGDSRAADLGCSPVSGCYSGYPSQYNMVRSLEPQLRKQTRKFISASMNTKIPRQRSNWWAFRN